MKKQLLLTIALLGVIAFASAQTSSVSFNGADTIFTVGQQDSDDLNDTLMVTVAGRGLRVDNNKFFGISTADTTHNDATGSFTFTLTTLSTTALDAILTLDMAKRPGCSVKGKVSVTGYTDVPFDSLSNGSDVSAVEEIKVEFGSISLTNTTPLTVTVTLEEMLNVDNLATPIFRLENVILEKETSTAVEAIFSAMEISLFPNPVVSSFQINVDETIENVRLFSSAGRLVKTFNNEISYDISDLSTGLYVVNVKTQSGSNTLRVVKK